MFKDCRRILLVCAALLSAAPVHAADVSKFPLSKVVPADVFIMVAGRHNPEREFLDRYWAKVFEAFARSGVCEEIWDQVISNIPDTDAEKAEAYAERFKKSIKQVRWSELFAQESVYCQRVGFPAWENVVLTKQSTESVESNFAGLKSILTELAKMAGNGAEVTESKFEGATLCRLSFADAPIAVTVARRNDVLAMALGDGLLKDCLSLLSGRGKQSPLVATDRFKSALAKLPEAEDSVTFFDAASMMNGMKKMFGVLAKQGGAKHGEESEGGDADPHGMMFKVFDRVLDDLSIWDYSVTVSRTEGFSTIDESLTVLKPDAKKRRAYRVFTPTAKFDNIDRLVPKEAIDFSVSDGINFVELNDWVVSLVRDTVPDGETYLTQWAEFQKEQKFDLRKDVLEWIEGPIISVTMPGGGFGGDAWVIMIKVRNEKKAASQVQRLVEAAQKLIGEQQGLALTDVEIDDHPNFHSISHPFMMMMQLPPIVWGTAEGYLIFGSGAKPISTCLKTLAGEHPGISKNPRFQKEGVKPDSGFVSASFTDTSKTAENLQAALTGITMGLGMMTTFAPAQAEEGSKFFKAIPAITGKLVKVVARLNFFLSESTATSFDGKTWRSTSVTNYKDPKSVRGPADEAESDESGEDETESPKPPKVEKRPKAPEPDEDDDE